jgi:hypothetical protein
MQPVDNVGRFRGAARDLADEASNHVLPQFVRALVGAGRLGS